MLTIVQYVFLETEVLGGGLSKIFFAKENMPIYRFSTIQVLVFSEKCTVTSEN